MSVRAFYAPPMSELSGHSDRIWGVHALSGCEIVVTAGGDGVAKCWSSSSLCTRTVAPSPRVAVVACRVIQTRVYYAAGQQVFSFDTATDVSSVAESAPSTSNSLVLCIDASPPLVYVGYADGQIRVWKGGLLKGRYVLHQG